MGAWRAQRQRARLSLGMVACVPASVLPGEMIVNSGSCDSTAPNPPGWSPQKPNKIGFPGVLGSRAGDDLRIWRQRWTAELVRLQGSVLSRRDNWLTGTLTLSPNFVMWREDHPRSLRTDRFRR